MTIGSSPVCLSCSGHLYEELIMQDANPKILYSKHGDKSYFVQKYKLLHKYLCWLVLTDFYDEKKSSL